MSERITEAELLALEAHRTYDDGKRLIAEVRRLRGLIAWAGGPLAVAHVRAARVGNLGRIVDEISDDYRMARAFLAEAEAIRAE